MSKTETVLEEKEVASDSNPTGRMAFTPGPWIAIEYEDGAFDIRSESNGYVCEGRYWIPRLAKRGIANAHLIASAPELLEACREIIDGMIDGPNATQKNVTAYAVHKVRAAIAKAEGRA